MSEARTDFDWVHKDVAAEVLKQAQSLVAAQHVAIGAVDAKLTAVLGHAVTLGTAAFGAAALPFADKAWMPIWAGIGLLVAGLFAVGSALTAWVGLDVREYAAPGLSPDNTGRRNVLKAAPQTAMMLMAGAYRRASNVNSRAANSLEFSLGAARAMLLLAPAAGLCTAAGLSLWLRTNQIISAACP